MEKKLPSIFKNNDPRYIDNNKKVYYSFLDRGQEEVFTSEEQVNLEDEYLFNTTVEIETLDGHFSTKIVGKLGDHILTSNNKIIKIKDIKKITIIR